MFPKKIAEVSFLGVGYDVTYTWKEGVFMAHNIYPPIKNPVLELHIKEKAEQQAISDEYDEWCRNNIQEWLEDDSAPEIQLILSKKESETLDNH